MFDIEIPLLLIYSHLILWDSVQLPVKLKATEVWRGPQAGVVKGSMEFSPSSTQGMTKLKVDVSGLNSEADGYHVHEKPLNIENPGQNICKKTGGHYNPLGKREEILWIS